MLPIQAALTKGYAAMPMLAARGSTLFAKALVARRMYSNTLPKYKHFRTRVRYSADGDEHDLYGDFDGVESKFQVPKRVRSKLISAEDAVALVKDGDTVTASGFVCQGAPEALLKALGERFEESQSPKNLTLFFGGGPGDYGERGLSHLAKISEDGNTQMLRRTIGGHYGQVPKVAELVLNEKVEAWTLPMGSVSRMIRAQSTHSPGHITTVGLGTYVDPEIQGGAANESAKKSTLHKKLVSRIDIDGHTNLMYKALPVHVALIRGTTGDAQGNISIEHESLLCDQKINAAAAKNSGGIVIAQVKRVAADGSIPAREVAIPGPLVDCVVVVDQDDHDELHAMSYIEKHNSALTHEVRAPQTSLAKMPLNIRKIIARRAFLGLEPNTIVNLGIGIPDGVASIAAEEGMLDYITLTTEPGVFGGLPASGHNFGPAYNSTSLMEMNQMFDFYDGGGLDMTFLGAAEISGNGDVNVSRMSKDRLTGPGGFIDISSSTKNVFFMTTFTTKGIKVEGKDGQLTIKEEGKVKKFVNDVYEKTFSGDEAVRRGQTVYYVTERAVFRRSRDHDVIELVEIAPGVDLQKDILDQMEFEPAISPDLEVMDARIFVDEKMNAGGDFFGSLEERFAYHEDDHTMFLDLFGVTLSTEEDVTWFFDSIKEILTPLREEKGKINMVISYEGFDLSKGLEEQYGASVQEMQREFYLSAKRYTGQAFQRAQLKNSLHMAEWDADELFDKFDIRKDGVISMEELRLGLAKHFQMHLTPAHMKEFLVNSSGAVVDREAFSRGIHAVLETSS